MAVINLFVVISMLIFCLFLVGLHNFVTNHETNKCQMTYMFEYPQYVRISFPGRRSHQFVRYGLYAYGEGQLTEKLRKMSFSGIPVLFIPGNSGSYKQVRSLASVSLRKAISSHSPYHFDFFAVDLNEEYSALYGGILDDQTEFVRLSIRRILQLYSSAVNSPKSVILIGHSMGGMVARGLFLSSNFDRHTVRIILTLATPHQQPVVALDSHIASYYRSVNAYWDENRAGNLSHITFVSIGGGHRDVLVRSDLTYARQADLSVLTTALPGVWLSTDHQCSVWCKELVLVVVRTLFDMVDTGTRQVSSRTADHVAAVHYHMVHRTAGKRLVSAFHPPVVQFDVRGEWRESVLRQYSVDLRDGVRVATHVMVRLLPDHKHQMLAVEAIGLSDKDWVFACTADTVVNNARVCESGVNLSNWTHISPSIRHKRKVMLLNMTLLHQKPFTHVILRVLPTDDPVQLNVDIHASGRHFVHTLPSWFLTSEHTVLESTDDRAVRYTVELQGLECVWQAYRLFVEPKQCKRAMHHAVASFKVGWRREDSHVYITENVSDVLRVRLHTPEAGPLEVSTSPRPRVELTLDPACKYSVRLLFSAVDSLAQLVRFYGPMLWAYVCGVLLLTVRQQLLSVEEHGSCVMFHSALAAGARPLSVLPLLFFCYLVLSWDVFPGPLPAPDVRLLMEQGLVWPLLPVVLFAVAFSLVYLLGIGCWMAVIFSGHAVHKTALRFLARSLVGSLSLSEWMLTILNKLPVAVASFLLTVCFSSCGALALGVASTFFFLKLSKMYDDYLEDLFKSSIKLVFKGKKGTKQEAKGEETQVIGDGDGQQVAAAVADETGEETSSLQSELHFSFTLLLLVVALTSLNMPCVLTWAHNFRYSAKLRHDPSFVVSIITSLCLGVLWQMNVPRPYIEHSGSVRHLLFGLALAMFLYAPVSLYRLGPLVAAALTILTLHQMLAARTTRRHIKHD